MKMFINSCLTDEPDKYDITNVEICLSDDPSFSYLKELKVYPDYKAYLADNNDENKDESGSIMTFVKFYDDLCGLIEKYDVDEIICFDDMFSFSFQWNCRKYKLRHRLHNAVFKDISDYYTDAFPDSIDFDLDVMLRAFEIGKPDANGVKSLNSSLEETLSDKKAKFAEYLDLIKSVREVREMLKDYSEDKLRFFADYLVNRDKTSFPAFEGISGGDGSADDKKNDQGNDGGSDSPDGKPEPEISHDIPADDGDADSTESDTDNSISVSSDPADEKDEASDTYDESDAANETADEDTRSEDENDAADNDDTSDPDERRAEITISAGNADDDVRKAPAETVSAVTDIFSDELAKFNLPFIHSLKF